MEKALKYKHHGIFGPIVILFKEELEQLTELFNSNFSEIEIEADGFKLANISEINELNKDIIRDFRITGKDKDNYSNNMYLEISKKLTYISIDARNDTKCLGVVNKINEIIRSRRRISNILVLLKSYWSIIITLAIFIILSSLLIYYKIDNKNAIKKEYLEIYLTIILTSPFILYLFLLYLSNFIYNSIYLKYSWEQPNFYKRNKDNIIVGSVCAFLGTVIGGLLIYFITKKFWGSPNP